MAQQASRRNEQLLDLASRGSPSAAVTGAALSAMHVSPSWLQHRARGRSPACCALATAELGVLVAVIALCLPMIAAQPVLGLGALVLGVVAVQLPRRRWRPRLPRSRDLG